MDDMDFALSVNGSDFTLTKRRSVAANLHIHNRYEIVFVIEGTLCMQIGKTPYDIPAGYSVFAEPYEPHSFLSKEENCALIIEFSPAFYPAFHKFLSSHSTAIHIAEIPFFSAEYIKHISSPLSEEGFANVSLTDAYSFLAPLCRGIIEGCRWEERRGNSDDLFINALKYVSDNYDKPLSRASVARALGVCPETLSRTFQKSGEISFISYVQYIRVYNSLHLLKEGNTVAYTAYSVGFESIRTFNRVFNKIIGMTPSDYVRQL